MILNLSMHCASQYTVYNTSQYTLSLLLVKEQNFNNLIATKVSKQ